MAKKVDCGDSNNGHFPRAARGRQPKLADKSFLPDLTSDEIGEMYKAEKDSRDMQKMRVCRFFETWGVSKC